MAGYVEKTLAHGEDIVHRANFNWTYSFFPVLWFALGAAPMVMFSMLQFGAGLHFAELRSGWYVAGAGFLVGGLILLNHIIELVTTEIVVTTYRFVFKTGLISRSTQEVSLNKIEEIILRQTVWGRLFGFGKLVLRGTGVGVIELPALDNPIGLRRIIESTKSALRSEGRRTSDDD